MRPLGRCAAAFVTCSLAFLAAVAASPAASAAPSSTRDSATATGWHFQTLHDADVIAASPVTNVVVWYQAGRPLTDGTVSVVLPGAVWPTPLHALNGPLYNDPANDGDVIVRPADGIAERTIDPSAQCSAPAATPTQVSVRKALGSQIVVVQHVTCAPGQRLAVRIFGIAVPSRVGRTLIPVVAYDGSGLPRLIVATLDVYPTPSITLHVDNVPTTVIAGVSFFIHVTATQPNGQLATNYQGAVAVVSEDQYDCTLTPRDESIAHQFIPADGGSAYFQVSLSQPGLAHLLEIYDVGNTALPAVSTRFEVLPNPDLHGIICSVSYD